MFNKKGEGGAATKTADCAMATEVLLQAKPCRGGGGGGGGGVCVWGGGGGGAGGCCQKAAWLVVL